MHRSAKVRWRSYFVIDTLMSSEQPILTYKTKFDKNDLYNYIRLYVASETILIVVSESYIQSNLYKISVFVNFRLVRQNQLSRYLWLTTTLADLYAYLTYDCEMTTFLWQLLYSLYFFTPQLVSFFLNHLLTRLDQMFCSWTFFIAWLGSFKFAYAILTQI